MQLSKFISGTQTYRVGGVDTGVDDEGTGALARALVVRVLQHWESAIASLYTS